MAMLTCAGVLPIPLAAVLLQAARAEPSTRVMVKRDLRMAIFVVEDTRCLKNGFKILALVQLKYFQETRNNKYRGPVFEIWILFNRQGEEVRLVRVVSVQVFYLTMAVLFH